MLHGKEKSVWADKGYIGAEREAAFSKHSKVWGVMRKAPKGGKLDPIDEKINRITEDGMVAALPREASKCQHLW